MVRVTGKGGNILAADLSFQAGKEFVREALTIVMSESPKSADSWKVVVEAHIAGGGVFVVGTIQTKPPVTGGVFVRAAPSDPPNRVIALAYVPGVSSWKIYVYGPRGAKAQFQLSSGHYATGGLNRALVPVNGSTIIRTGWVPSPVDPASIKTVQGIASQGPCTLLMGYGYRDVAAVGFVFLGFVDKDTPIVNGDQFVVAPFVVPLPEPLPVPLTPRQLNYTFGDNVTDGLRFEKQARWCVSTTDAFVTLDGGANAMRVQNKVV
jgi:hypothetical protein